MGELFKGFNAVALTPIHLVMSFDVVAALAATLIIFCSFCFLSQCF